MSPRHFRSIPSSPTSRWWGAFITCVLAALGIAPRADVTAQDFFHLPDPVGSGQSAPSALMTDQQIEQSLGRPTISSQVFDNAPPSPQYMGFGNTANVDPWHWQFRPRGTVYPTYLASVNEPRLTASVIDINGRGFTDSHIGGRLGFFKYGPKNSPQGFQFDVLAGAMLRQDLDQLDVFAVDFRYDILGTYRQGRHALKFGFYHVSAHAGDEFLLNNPGFTRLNFFRDALVLGYSFYMRPDLRLYAEYGWGFNNELSEPNELQFGIDWAPAQPTGLRGAPFFAINGHLREEQDFGGNLVVQAGWAWKVDQLDGLLRTGVHYYNGASPQFSFFDQYEQQIGWALWYDF